MPDCRQIVLMATYNEWMNNKLYEAAATLPSEAVKADRQAFFGSLLGTLNHIALADTIWLKRFAEHPARPAALDPIRVLPKPGQLSELLFEELDGLARHRRFLDRVILDWATSLREEDLSHILHYANMKGVLFNRHFGSLLLHFFNHQTHHRGQATTLLFQAGVDPGATDLLMLIPEAPTL